jgi:hypothetical protein
MNFKDYEKQANKLNLKFFRIWAKNYFKFLIVNNLKHNEDLFIAYYNRVILLK